MGLLDSVLGSLMGGGTASPLQSVLTAILAGGGGGAGGGLGGGLPGLIEQFNKAGLGQVVNSWVSNQQPNQPISPDALHQVFGQEQVNQWAQQTGMSQDNILGELAKMLPHAVDHMTPNGEVPSSPFDEPGLEMPQR